MLDVVLNFRSWITAMEPGELELYLELKKQSWCTDISTEIYPHHNKMYPSSLKEITALDRGFLKNHEQQKHRMRQENPQKTYRIAVLHCIKTM